MKNEWGYTNDDAEYATVVAWRDAAIADGWVLTPTYGDHEPATSYGTLTKDGFKAHACCRVTDEMARRMPHNRSKWKYESQITIWGPDGLDVKVPEIYDWSAILAGTRVCYSCGKTDVSTQRYSFAGRCCAECRPAMAAATEQPGWCE